MKYSVVSMYYSANIGSLHSTSHERHGRKLDETKTEVRAPKKLIHQIPIFTFSSLIISFFTSHNLSRQYVESSSTDETN
jgi:hypothetical protein